MFGKNELAPLEHTKSGDTLDVHSVFPTIQGEGPFVGQPCIFVRLAGCNLKCHFCDTDFTSISKTTDISSLFAEVEKHSANLGHAKLVVLTGGEPLRQNVTPFIRMLTDMNYDVQIETAGTVWPPGLDALIQSYESDFEQPITVVCSPKTGKVHRMVEQYCKDFKYIISRGNYSTTDGLPIFSSQDGVTLQRCYRPPRLGSPQIWLQPCDEYKEDGTPDPEASRVNLAICSELAMRYNYRLSVQLHKIAGLP